MQVEHIFLFGERQGFADHPAESLPNGVVQALNMASFTGAFAYFLVGHFGDAVVGGPKVRETETVQVGGQQLAPQFFAGCHRAVADEERKYLLGAAALHDPDAHLIDFQPDEGKSLVNLQSALWFCGLDGLFEGAQRAGFFFSHF